jgi:lactoylglutathione lyase
MKKILYTSLTILTLLAFLTKASAQPKGKLNHLAIYVVDLEKTRAFYNDMFQLDTIPEPFHDGKHIWYSIAPGVAMHVIQGADKPKEYFLNNHMCFSVAAVDPFVEKLRARNQPFRDSKGVLNQVTTRIDGVKQIWVNDPDGYFIEINDAKN